MRNPKLVIAGVGIAAAATIGGVTAAVASGSPTSGGGRYGGGAPASSAPAGAGSATTTVRTVRAAVGGKAEQILVNSQGLPLYYYQPDTATESLVDTGLAQAWPPLTSAAPTAAGVTGALTVVHDRYGNQVAYRGHLMYTFTSDSAGHVTGQGVANFYVATPGLASLAGSPSTSPPASSGGPVGGYGY